MELSKRLQNIADLVIPGSRVADIGCDHAYIPIYLVKNKISTYVIAMDMNQGPIERAKMNIDHYGYKDMIKVRKSDGLKGLKPGEVDSLIIAGMGGRLIMQILSESKDSVLNGIKNLILQPQSEVDLVRRSLKDFGYLIVQENMINEDGKFYVMMRAEKRSMVENSEMFELNNQEHYHFGRVLLEQQHNILHEFLIEEKKKLDKIYGKLMERPTKKTLLRQQEILLRTKLVDKGLGHFYEGENLL